MNLFLALPHELRLRIYQEVVTDPRPIIIMSHDSVGDACRWKDAQSLQTVDRELAMDIMPLYWSNNVFSLYLTVGDRNGDATSGTSNHDCAIFRTFDNWLEAYVGSAVPCLRRLEFVVTSRCEHRRKALEHPKEPGIWSATAHSEIEHVLANR